MFRGIFFLVLSYDPWFPIYRLPKLKNLRNFSGRPISRDPRNLKFRRFSILGADISGTKGHMTKPRKRWPQNTLFFHPSEGFFQGMKVWIEKILKIPYTLYLGVLESHNLLLNCVIPKPRDRVYGILRIFQSKLSSPDKIFQRGGSKVYFAATIFLELSYDP